MTELKHFFGNQKPSLELYKVLIKEKSEKEKERINLLICQLAFGYWRQLPAKHTSFIEKWILHHWDIYHQYLLNYTPLGTHRLKIKHIPILLICLCLLVRLQIISKMSYVHIAANFLVCFDIDLKISSLRVYLHKNIIKLYELLQLLGKTSIDDENIYLNNK